MPHVEVRLIDRPERDENPHLDFVLLDAVGVIEQFRREGRTVLVHCVGAYSRTPTVGALYGARLRNGQRRRRALRDVMAALPGAHPNPAFREALRRIGSTIRRRSAERDGRTSCPALKKCQPVTIRLERSARPVAAVRLTSWLAAHRFADAAKVGDWRPCSRCSTIRANRWTSTGGARAAPRGSRSCTRRPGTEHPPEVAAELIRRGALRSLTDSRGRTAHDVRLDKDTREEPRRKAS